MLFHKITLAFGLAFLALAGVAQAKPKQVCTHFAHIKLETVKKVTSGGFIWTAQNLAGTTVRVAADPKAFVGKQDLQLYTSASNTVGAGVLAMLAKPVMPLDGVRVVLTVRRSSAARTLVAEISCGGAPCVIAEMDAADKIVNYSVYNPVTGKNEYPSRPVRWKNGHNYTFAWTFHRRGKVVTYDLKVTDDTAKRVVAALAEIRAAPPGANNVAGISVYAAGGTNPDNTADAAETFYIGQICVGRAATHRARKR